MRASRNRVPAARRVLSRAVAEALEDRLLFYSVTSGADAGPGTLRQAILDANAHPGPDVITGPANDVLTVELMSALPPVTEAATFSAIRVTIKPAAALGAVDFDGLVFESDGSSVKGFYANGFRNGIVVRGNNNRFGTDTVMSYGGGASFNTGDGVRVESGSGNQVLGFQFIGNGGLAINLGADGPTPNDPLDADAGPNGLQNSPQLVQEFLGDTGALNLVGTLQAKPNTTYRIDVSGGLTSDAGGRARSETYFGNGFVTTDAAGDATFHLVTPSFGVGTYAAVTATDPAGSTSEFSAPVVIPRGSTVVTNANATGPGSLNAALAHSNFNPGLDVVSFDIPGAGVHRITIDPSVAPLPELSRDLTIDGTTQPGYAGSPVIEIVGTTGPAGGARCLYFHSGSAIVVRGLAIGGFGTAIVMGAGRVEGNYLGLAADGTPLPNGYGIEMLGDVTIGGTLARARNVISGNTVAGIVSYGTGENVVIQGNYIGTNPAGNAAIPNGLGIAVGSGNNTIGGSVAAARNVISGNTGVGVRLAFNSYQVPAKALPTYVRGNYIGVAADGVTPLGNGGDGILNTGTAVIVGGVQPGEANVIANNAGNGVTVAVDLPGTGQRTTVRGNSIYANGKLPVDLAGNGPTPNDAKDPDAGANALQNFPLLATAGAVPGATAIAGSLNSIPNATFTLDFYANPAGQSQGRTYLGSATVTTGAGGDAAFALALPVPAAPGQSVTATATDAAGNTSEFSAGVAVLRGGDANADGAVDFKDLVLVAQRYGAPAPRGWADGDFNLDGRCDFSDLVLVAQNYDVPPVPSASAPTAAAVRTVAPAKAPEKSIFNTAVRVAPPKPTRPPARRTGR